MTDTAIEWTDKTWNPVTGCSKVSPGCAHCYAEGVAERFWGKQYPKVEFCGEQLPRARQFTDVWPKIQIVHNRSRPLAST